MPALFARVRRRGRAGPAPHERRLRPPRRLRHADLHAARARPEHRRRLRRPARPRLHRLLRLRRLRLRDALVRPVPRPLADDPRSSPIVVAATALLGLLVGAAVAPARRRLPRDRDALLRAARSSPSSNNGNRISMPGFTRGYNITNGPNGIANIDPFHLFGHQLESLQSYFYVALALLRRRARRRLPRQQLADRPGLALAARGPARGRADGHAGATGSSSTPSPSAPPSPASTGTLFASLNTAVFSSRLRHAAADHDLRDGDPRRRRQPRRRDPRRDRRQRRRSRCCGRPNHATWVFFALIVATLRRASCGPGGCSRPCSAATIASRLRGARDRRSRSRPRAAHGTGAVARLARPGARPLGPAPDRPAHGRATTPSSRSSLLVLVLTSVRPLWRHAAPRPDAVPRGVRLGCAARVRAQHHAADPDRRDPDRAHERPPAGARRHDAGGDRLMTDRLLDLRGRLEELRRPRLHPGARPARRRGRDRQRDRPERRRQDDALQPDHRRLRARRGRDRVRGRRACSGSSRTRSSAAGSPAPSSRCGSS